MGQKNGKTEKEMTLYLSLLIRLKSSKCKVLKIRHTSQQWKIYY